MVVRTIVNGDDANNVRDYGAAANLSMSRLLLMTMMWMMRMTWMMQMM